MAVNVKSCNLFGGIAQMEHMAQLGALRAAPGAASLPRTGRGEALVQQPKPNSRANDSRNPPFSPGGEGERAPPPPPRRRAALGPMPYGNTDTWLIFRSGPSSERDFAFLVYHLRVRVDECVPTRYCSLSWRR